MSKLINLYSEDGPNIIGDDTTPALTFSSSGGNLGLKTGGLACTSGATIDALFVHVGPGASLATITGLSIAGGSVASGALLKLGQFAYVSTTTINPLLVDQDSTYGAIRVVLPKGQFGWIPVYNDSQVTAVVK